MTRRPALPVKPDARGAPGRDPAALRFAVIILDHFAIMPFAGFVDMLRIVSSQGIDRSQQCTWQILAADPGPIRSSCGVTITPDALVCDAAPFDYLAILGGNPTPVRALHPDVAHLIQDAAARNLTLIGISSGIFALHRAGVMDGYLTCIHNYYYNELKREFPDANIITDRKFVVDKGRITCAGGISAIDLAGWILSDEFSRNAVQVALNLLSVDGSPSQKLAAERGENSRLIDNNKVRDAVQIMDTKINAPANISELAKIVGLSTRHLERLFKAEMGMSPQQYGLEVRLRYALWALLNTRRPLAEIAAECGFNDQSHFGRAFRARYGATPSRLRAHVNNPGMRSD